MPKQSTAKPHIFYLTQVGTLHDERFLVKLRDAGYPVTYVSLAKDRNTQIEGIQLHSLGLPQGGGRIDSIRRYAGTVLAILRVRRLIKEYQPDILHSGIVTTAGLVAGFSGFHPHISMPWGSDILIQSRESRFRKLIARFALGSADLITCDAETVKSRALEISPRDPNEITVFPWGVDLNIFKPDSDQRQETRSELGLDDDAEVMITTRWLAPLYGIHEFIKSLPEVFSKRPNATAVIVGDGPQLSELESLSANLGLTQRVKFIGAVDNPGLPKYLNASDLYVSPSHSDGTSLSLLEAMGCGLPVVVTDIESIREWVVENENGLLTPIGDHEQLSTTLISALSDTELLKRAAVNNLNQARARADWDINFAKLQAMYEELIDERQ
jgi:L-malate glycosyltransferase